MVRFLPALVASDQQIDQAAALFTEAVVEIDRELQAGNATNKCFRTSGPHLASRR